MLAENSLKSFPIASYQKTTTLAQTFVLHYFSHFQSTMPICNPFKINGLFLKVLQSCEWLCNFKILVVHMYVDSANSSRGCCQG